MDNEDDIIRPISRQLPKECNMERGDLVTYPAYDRGGYSFGVIVSVLPGSIILDTYTAEPIRIEVDRVGVVLQYKKCEWESSQVDAMKQDTLEHPVELPVSALERSQSVAPTRRQPASEEGIVRL